MTQHIQQHARKAIGLEMETYGAFFCGENCTKPRPEVFSVKSACDFADAERDDEIQDYAAFTSAQYMWCFALDHLAQ
jgi:nucleoside phosphorylase